MPLSLFLSTSIPLGFQHVGQILDADQHPAQLGNVFHFTATPACTSTLTATLLPIVNALPGTGGGPKPNQDFPWNLVIFGGFSAIALGLGIRAYRRTYLPKQ